MGWAVVRGVQGFYLNLQVDSSHDVVKIIWLQRFIINICMFNYINWYYVCYLWYTKVTIL